MKYDYDMIVIGGGAAGYVSSKLAAGLGKKVLVIERDKLGGECSHSGCVPSKAFIRAASAAESIKHASDFSLDVTYSSLYTKRALAYVQKIVAESDRDHQSESLTDWGIELAFGEPLFIDNHTILLADKKITSKTFMLATGSHAFIPPIEGLDRVDFLTNENFFTQEVLPDSMIVLGGGPIGIELAQSLNRLGVKTTVVEMAERILPREEKEYAQLLEKELKKEGLHLLTGTKAVKVSSENGLILLETESGGKTGIIKAHKLLVAVGRKPNLDRLDLEKAGVQVEKGFLKLNRKLQTTSKNIYAAGDAAGPYQFSHMAEYQAVIAARNALLPLPKKKARYDNVVWTTFTTPELAHLGLTEEEARAKYNDSIRVYTWEYAHLDRARADSRTTGKAKVITDKKFRILGAHIIGYGAGDFIHEVQILKSSGIVFTKMAGIIHGYPTYSDMIRQMAKKAYIDSIRENIFVKLLGSLRKKK